MRVLAALFLLAHGTMHALLPAIHDELLGVALEDASVLAPVPGAARVMTLAAAVAFWVAALGVRRAALWWPLAVLVASALSGVLLLGAFHPAVLGPVVLDLACAAVAWRALRAEAPRRMR